MADDLCGLLSVDGIPVVQKYINDGYYDDTMLSLEESLYVTCMIAGVSLPELAQWKKEIEAEEKRTELLDESTKNVVGNKLKQHNWGVLKELK